MSLQQAPTHAPGEQEEPAPANVTKRPSHSTLNDTVQVDELFAQQAPVSAAQGLGEQAVWGTKEPASQFDGNVSAHVVPMAWQHAPAIPGHGSGAHEAPDPANVPLPWVHIDGLVTVHAMVVLLQQAPMQKLGEQPEPTPRNTSPPSAPQPCRSAMRQVPSARQHAPNLAAHWSGEHDVPFPRYAPLQLPEPTTCAHAPLGNVQQPPETPMHGSGEHTERYPWNDPPPATFPHRMCVEIVHEPVVLAQHAPAQGLGEHEVPMLPKMASAPVQAELEVNWHCVPCEAWQHEPRQGLAVHELPAPPKNWPPVHPAASLDWQAPVPVSQQAPTSAGQGLLGEQDDPLTKVPPLWKHWEDVSSWHAAVVLLQHAPTWAIALRAGASKASMSASIRTRRCGCGRFMDTPRTRPLETQRCPQR